MTPTPEPTWNDRGRGMYVSEGARRSLLDGERERFLSEQWPHISPAS